MIQPVSPRLRGLCSLALSALVLAGCAHQPAPTASTVPVPTTPAKPTTAQVATPAPASAAKVSAPGTMFDGVSLAGWQIADFAGTGPVTVEKGEIRIGLGHMTGITWTNELPRMGYEISLEARRVEGSDFFCGLTFPVGKEPCSFIVGGWGGGVVGLSSIDSEDASQNETTSYMNFVNGRWYTIRLRVEPGKIQAWIDGDRVVNFEKGEHKLSIRLEVEPSLPLGISTWNTAAGLRNIQLKKL